MTALFPIDRPGVGALRRRRSTRRRFRCCRKFSPPTRTTSTRSCGSRRPTRRSAATRRPSRRFRRPRRWRRTRRTCAPTWRCTTRARKTGRRAVPLLEQVVQESPDRATAVEALGGLKVREGQAAMERGDTARAQSPRSNARGSCRARHSRNDLELGVLVPGRAALRRRARGARSRARRETGRRDDALQARAGQCAVEGAGRAEPDRAGPAKGGCDDSRR